MTGPKYHPPCPQVPNCWHAEAVVLEPEIKWWEGFCDPLLNKYMGLAALQNRDVIAAKAAICQARAMKMVTASKLFPQIRAGFNALRVNLGKDGPFDSESLPVPIPIPTLFSLYTAFLDAKWEIDVFGKNRRNVEVASANIGVAIEQKNEVLISIFAEIAMNYFQVRSAQAMIALIEKNIALWEENAFVAGKQYKSGLKGALDYERIEAELAGEEAKLPDVYAEMFQGIYALSVLTGNLPETFLCELLPLQPLPCPPCNVAVGLRSDVLLRRPDVREAERNLAAATANIGVAVASFYPRFSLRGLAGFNSTHIGNLFSARSKFWLIDGDVSVPLFDGGNLIGNLYISEAQAIQSSAHYQETVLTALSEAETALKNYEAEFETSRRLLIAVKKNERVVDLTNERYTKGLVAIIDLLDTKRQLIGAEEKLLQSQSAALNDLVILYKALGGGWECFP